MNRYLELYPRWVNIMTKGVCQEWQSFLGFHDWAVKNRLTDVCQLLRCDLTKVYSPENCYIIGNHPAENTPTAEPDAPAVVPTEKKNPLKKGICESCRATCPGQRKDCMMWQYEYKVRWDEVAEFLRNNLPE